MVRSLSNLPSLTHLSNVTSSSTMLELFPCHTILSTASRTGLQHLALGTAAAGRLLVEHDLPCKETFRHRSNQCGASNLVIQAEFALWHPRKATG